MSDSRKPRLIGINHVAIEVGDIDEALAWYGRIFDFTLRGKGERNAFIDMGDQFINMTLVPATRREGAERRGNEQRRKERRAERRHIGFVVDDRSRIIELAKAAGAVMVEGPFLDFLDPWGNRLEIIEYSNIQFTKAPHVMRGMGLALDKNDNAKKELAEKGMAAE
jgi:catechol 2,3-dioxygenase-like lactoylglutathione lyase family enzyme